MSNAYFTGLQDGGDNGMPGTVNPTGLSNDYGTQESYKELFKAMRYGGDRVANAAQLSDVARTSAGVGNRVGGGLARSGLQRSVAGQAVQNAIPRATAGALAATRAQQAQDALAQRMGATQLYGNLTMPIALQKSELDRQAQLAWAKDQAAKKAGQMALFGSVLGMFGGAMKGGA